MVEGDLVDLTLPTLLHALATESSTATLRLQHGTEQGELFFSEGALVHAVRGEAVGDDAVLEVLGWTDGRFRITRDPDRQPRTVTRRVTEFLKGSDRSSSHATPSGGNGGGAFNTDEELLTALLTLLTRLEQDRVRLAAELRGELGALGDGAERVLVDRALVVQRVDQDVGHLDQLPLVEPRDDLLDRLVGVFVLDDLAGGLRRRRLRGDPLSGRVVPEMPLKFRPRGSPGTPGAA